MRSPKGRGKALKIDMSTYYVYELRDESGQVFYVGKGTKYRINFHEWAACAGKRGHLYNTIRKIWRDGGVVVKEKIAVGLTHPQAISIERMLIAKYGKRSSGGLLVNITDGGEGAPGYKHDAVTRMKMRASWKPKKLTPEGKARRIAALKGRKQTKEHREKLSKAISGVNHWNYGQKISEAHAEALHAAMRKKVSVDGVIYPSVSAAARAHGITGGTASYRLHYGKRRGEKYGEWKWA